MVCILLNMKDKTRTLFCDNLRRLRLEKGLTQTELGKKIGLSKRAIVHYENHAKQTPIEKIASLAKALGVKTDDLINNKTKNSTPKIDPKFARKLEKAKKLPKNDQIIVTSMIDTLFKKNRSK